jgi:hypothetical protein
MCSQQDIAEEEFEATKGRQSESVYRRRTDNTMRSIFFRYIENSRECYNKSCWIQTYPPGDKSGRLYNIDSGKDQEEVV